MVPIKPESNISSTKEKRKPVHIAKPLSADQIRKQLKISKRDILIARTIVNKHILRTGHR